jgi:hypothetical protein
VAIAPGSLCVPGMHETVQGCCKCAATLYWWAGLQTAPYHREFFPGQPKSHGSQMPQLVFAQMPPRGGNATLQRCRCKLWQRGPLT